MIALLGTEILAMITKEIVKHQPAIQAAIMAELEVVAASMYKYVVSSMSGEVDKLEKK